MLTRKLLCIMLAALMLVASTTPLYAQARARSATNDSQNKVILVSLDGLAFHIWSQDPVARELRSLREIASEGAVAGGMIQSFPSITPAGHAALWTGAYGNVSGIITSNNPVLPRSEHSAFDRISGYYATALLAEPLWVTAARQGVRVVAHQTTQNYPFVSAVTAPGAVPPPVLATGYGPEELAPEAVIRAADTTAEDAAGWVPPLPRSSLAVRGFRWAVGDVTFHGALVAEKGARRGYTAMYVATDRKGPRVRVAPFPVESMPPRNRPLARRFSDALLLRAGKKNVATATYFRLFELAPDGGDFLLYQPSLHEMALYDGGENTEATIEAMLKEAGGFIGNGPSNLYKRGLLGRQLYAGGKGVAERRYLEGAEIVIRQLNRLTAWLYKRYSPRLLIDYCPYPDEMEHTFYGLVRPDVTGVRASVARGLQQYRRWAYVALDKRVALLNSLAGPGGSIVFGSDHGMSPVAKQVKVNVALRDAGLLFVNNERKIDKARTQAVHLKYCVVVNTSDWRGGIVPVARRKAIVDAAEQALSKVRDPETGQAVFIKFFRPEVDGEKLGIGGAAGGDLYFELAPGYAASDDLQGEVIEGMRAPEGAHGFLSTRPEMLAIFITRGPRVPRGITIPTIHSIDVAPFVAQLLGIAPPAQSKGMSPLKLKAETWGAKN